MSKQHLVYRNFRGSTLQHTNTLFENKPWRGSSEQIIKKYHHWSMGVSEGYGIEHVCVAMTPLLREHGVIAINDVTEQPYIVLQKPSITTLFYMYRIYMFGMDVAEPIGDYIDDAQAWAYSLYYTARPRLFARAVRKGYIPGVTEIDLVPDTSDEASKLLSQIMKEE